MTIRSWVEISRTALRQNVRALRVVIGPERIFCAVVKANAYGHGIAEVARVVARASRQRSSRTTSAPSTTKSSRELIRCRRG